MIRGDWQVARLALQVIAEQGVGLVVAQDEARLDATHAASVRALGGR